MMCVEAISVQQGGTVMGDKSPKNKEKKKPKKDKKAAASASPKK